ncbi:MAG: dihydrodipicolinate synthase family protein, partial [Cyclobacteriaceae bacterium]
MSLNWHGVFPALTTKFTEEDKLDLPLFEKNLRAQLDAGVDGIILGGTLGESSVLRNEANVALLRLAGAKVAGKGPVLMNIAEGSTREASTLA